MSRVRRWRNVIVILILVSYYLFYQVSSTSVEIAKVVRTPVVMYETSRVPKTPPKESPKVVVPSRGGERRELIVLATAYTWTGNHTCTGVWPTPHRTVAVDPKVIPLGSHITINGESGYIAEDTGVRGNRIDIYMATYDEAIHWGVRDTSIIVEE